MILIISGTNRPNNYSHKMALQMQKMLEQGGQDSKVLSLEDLPSDMPVSEMFGQSISSNEKCHKNVNYTRKGF